MEMITLLAWYSLPLCVRTTKGCCCEIDLIDIIVFDASAKPFGLLLESLHQFGAGQSFRKAGIVFDFVGDGDLTADFVAGDQQGFESGRAPCTMPAVNPAGPLPMMMTFSTVI